MPVVTGTMMVLAGCATTRSVRDVAAVARHAEHTGQQALAAVQALQKQRQASDKTLQGAIAALQSQEQRTLRALTALQVQARRAARVRRVVKPTKRPAPPAVTKAEIGAVFAHAIARARALAQAPYVAPHQVAPVLRKLSFTDYGKISYQGRVPGWPLGTPFHIQLYPAGYLFTWPETIRVVAGSQSLLASPQATVSADPGLAARIPKAIPPAGFSVYTGFGKGPAVYEFLSFLGASYFRALGQGQAWGLSARGVAVDTALPHRAEEFPYFREFWLQAAHPKARHLAFCGLLDSPSLAGAYRFIVHPGATTTVDVKAVLFERRAVRRLGIAPLTSMFLQGRFSRRRFDPLVRAAHDSDGLAIGLPGNARLFWPLRDPRRIAIYRFPAVNPSGFGLMQRARRAGDYRAYGMHYEDRPSAWVTPEGNWGAGHLVLVELPTNTATNDNISVFWVPQRQAAPLTPMTFHYRISWIGHNPRGRHLGYVSAWRHAYDAASHSETYVVDFAGPVLASGAPAAFAPVVHVAGPAHVIDPWVTRNAAGDLRLQFGVARSGSGPVTIHAALLRGPDRVTETWGGSLPASR